ncbi:DNA topoisomerase 2-binding protein 1-A [Orchesella cincta]|uniref:DNA topoisomerase 2-binding protein 1-A n=1 Tax=Orchesella cincta TaxID=48709 RepID=A0A1D2MXY4_ORCCI|nr:DNA topoisomerase 2-binding protein 1-A [Orchesella cincta]
MSRKHNTVSSANPKSITSPPIFTDSTVIDTYQSIKSNKTKRTHSIVSVMAREKEFPMYIAMAKLCITPTGFADVESRDALVSKIELMCGDVSYSYTDRTTHLLAAHTNTPKVAAARDNNLPVMTLEWVEAIWEACQQNDPYIHASLPKFRNFECPLFYNLQFTISKHYEDDTREYYEKLLTEHGGTITIKVCSPLTSFYVCPKPETGRGYFMAQKYKIWCVSHGWIVDSVKVGTLMPARSYEVREYITSLDLLTTNYNGGTTFTIRSDGNDTNNAVACSNVPVVMDLIPISDESYSGNESTLSLSETVIDVDDNSTLQCNETIIDANASTRETSNVCNERCGDSENGADLLTFTDEDDDKNCISALVDGSKMAKISIPAQKLHDLSIGG